METKHNTLGVGAQIPSSGAVGSTRFGHVGSRRDLQRASKIVKNLAADQLPIAGLTKTIALAERATASR